MLHIYEEKEAYRYIVTKARTSLNKAIQLDALRTTSINEPY